MIDRAAVEGVRVSTHPAESVASPFTGVVAVDGPSGSGKSTVSRRLAAALGARYLDTGAMYRSLTWAVLTAGVDPADASGVVEVLGSARLEITTDSAGVTVTVDGRRVDAEIRGPEVTAAVSAVSAVPEVRSELVTRQRAIIGSGGIVVEGRDIGSVVAPDAELKVFLTASAEARAQRRSRERASADVAATQADLARRDGLDSSRVASPLVKAEDAVALDTTELGIDEVVERLLNLLNATAGSRR
jgi:cytidylate kinase